MIQRPQTLLLAGSIVLLLVSLFLPFWQLNYSTGSITLLNAWQLVTSDEQGIMDQREVFYIGLCFIGSMALSGFSISQFKDRLMQMKLGSLNSLLIASGLGISMYWVYLTEQQGSGLRGEFMVGFYLPLGAMLLNIISNRLIRRDQLVVKSSDRIR